MRKQYYGDSLSRTKLMLLKCPAVVEIATNFVGEDAAKLQEIEKLCKEGMAVETKNAVANLLVDKWRYRVEKEGEMASAIRQRPLRRGGTLAGGARGGGWSERSGFPGNALRWLP